MRVIRWEKMEKIKDIVADWDETLIWSCLQGCMGKAYALNEENPKSVKIITADFCFLGGEPNEQLVSFMPDDFIGEFLIMTPRHTGWNSVIEKVYEDKAEKGTRYAIKKEKDIFDHGTLNSIIENLSKEYELKMIDQTLFDKSKEEEWMYDLCSQYKTFEEYAENGLGVVALMNGTPVSGASSYTFYQGGIEIEIDTKQEYRRQGLALACGAKLILECERKGLYPSWDAQNTGSVALAEKLGYHFDYEYPVYYVSL